MVRRPPWPRPDKRQGPRRLTSSPASHASASMHPPFHMCYGCRAPVHIQVSWRHSPSRGAAPPCRGGRSSRGRRCRCHRLARLATPRFRWTAGADLPPSLLCRRVAIDSYLLDGAIRCLGKVDRSFCDQHHMPFSGCRSDGSYAESTPTEHDFMPNSIPRTAALLRHEVHWRTQGVPAFG